MGWGRDEPKYIGIKFPLFLWKVAFLVVVGLQIEIEVNLDEVIFHLYESEDRDSSLKHRCILFSYQYYTVIQKLILHSNTAEMKRRRKNLETVMRENR